MRLDLVRLIIPGGTLICSGLLGEQEYDSRNSLTEFGFEFYSSLERENCQVLVSTSRKTDLKSKLYAAILSNCLYCIVIQTTNISINGILFDSLPADNIE